MVMRVMALNLTWRRLARMPASMGATPPRTLASRRHLLLAFAMVAAAAAASAAERTVMSAGAVASGLRALVEQFQRAAGHTVRVEIGTTTQLAGRLDAGAAPDILIAPASVMERAIADNRAVGDTRVTVGRVGVGVIVHGGAAPPDISSPAELQRALLAADAVVYNQGSSGLYIERMFATLGLADRLTARTVRVADAEAVLARIAADQGRAIGFGAISAIRAYRGTGVRYAGPLPPTLQNVTTYEAASTPGARDPGAAAAFLAFITSPAARQAFLATGVE